MTFLVYVSLIFAGHFMAYCIGLHFMLWHSTGKDGSCILHLSQPLSEKE